MNRETDWLGGIVFVVFAMFLVGLAATVVKTGLDRASEAKGESIAARQERNDGRAADCKANGGVVIGSRKGLVCVLNGAAVEIKELPY